MEIKFNWYGLRKLQGKLKNWAKRNTNFHSVWRNVQKDFFQIEMQQFSTKGQGKWKHLNSKYAAWKRKNYPGRSILILKGDLKASLISKQTNHIYKPSKTQLEIGTKAPTAYFHQVTGPGGKKEKIRKVIDLKDKHKFKIMKTIQKWLVKTKKMAGLK